MSDSTVRKQHERDGGGLIATYEHQTSHERRVEVFAGVDQVQGEGRHRSDWAGGQKGAARAAADRCRQLGPDWRILSLSTPASIHSDTQVRKPHGASNTIVAPEPGMVGQANADTVHPRLLGTSTTSDRERREARA